MTTYTATFSNGVIISRKSNHDYRFAFLWTGTDANGRVHTRSGFSSSRELATKTMEGQCGWMHKRGDLAFAEVVAVSIPGPELLDATLNAHFAR